MPSPTIPAPLVAALVSGGGLVCAADCRELGISQDRIERMMRQGLIVTLAKGVYADRRQVATLPAWRAFRLRSRAFVLASPPNSHASDWSAVALHELPTVGAPPTVPSVIRLGSRSSGSNRTVHGRTRFAAVPDRWLTEVYGVSTLRPALVAVDLARACDRRTALMLCDAAASRDQSRSSLAQAALDLAAWPRIRRAQWAVQHADPDVESPLESIGRFALLRAGLPAGESNVWVGETYPRYRLDHYWSEYRLAAEADGIEKYSLTDPTEAVRAEKEREWQLQAWGIRVVRYSWPVAFSTPDALAERCATLMKSDPLPVSRPMRTWPRLDGYELRGMTPAISRWPGRSEAERAVIRRSA